MVNGMKNHKKIGIRLFAANHIQVSRLVNQSYRLELTLTGQINQVSGINRWNYARKYFTATCNSLKNDKLWTQFLSSVAISISVLIQLLNLFRKIPFSHILTIALLGQFLFSIRFQAHKNCINFSLQKDPLLRNEMWANVFFCEIIFKKSQISHKLGKKAIQIFTIR